MCRLCWQKKYKNWTIILFYFSQVGLLFLYRNACPTWEKFGNNNEKKKLSFIAKNKTSNLNCWFSQVTLEFLYSHAHPTWENFVHISNKYRTKLCNLKLNYSIEKYEEWLHKWMHHTFNYLNVKPMALNL